MKAETSKELALGLLGQLAGLAAQVKAAGLLVPPNVTKAIERARNAPCLELDAPAPSSPRLAIITTPGGYFQPGLTGFIVAASDRVVYPLSTLAAPLKVPEFTIQLDRGTRRDYCQYGRDFVFAAPLSSPAPAAVDLLDALAKCKAIVEDGSKPPSARLELVRDLATPILRAAGL
jgi:hypothetical protein